MKQRRLSTILAGALVGAGLVLPRLVQAHCDTMDGPVVQAARAALEQKDVRPVLKWVKPEGETEIKTAFAQTLAVRTQSPAARELADRFFFETLVRVHRAGEGAPFTGLKPAGSEVEPGIEAADQALESGSVDKAVKLVTDNAAAGIRKRFAEAREKQRHAEESVEAGREFVAAYVDYIHYVEGLHQAAQRTSAHDGHDHAASAMAAHQKPASPHQH